MSDQALSALRREVRAARLRLRRDTRFGLEAPRRVVQLSQIDLPPVVRRYRLARVARPGVVGKALDIYSDRRQAESSHGLDQDVNDTEVPAFYESEMTDGKDQVAAAVELSEEPTDLPAIPFSDRLAFPPVTPALVEATEAEHSGNVTLNLPKDLSRWLTDQHAAYRVSYPTIVLNAISWATARDRLREIFSPESSSIPVNDLFGRPVWFKPVRKLNGTETRTVRFRREHMKVIIGLARTWTADNRNAFFVGVLEAYRDREIERPAD